jgi:hypothetical protein
VAGLVRLCVGNSIVVPYLASDEVPPALLSGSSAQRHPHNVIRTTSSAQCHPQPH